MVGPVLRALDPRPDARIVDATLGLGGHAEALLRELGPAGRVIGIDRDSEMLALASERLAPFGERFRGVQARLGFLGDVLRGQGLDSVDGILMDLGVCSAHLDDPERGFSFRANAAHVPLDMRMDRSRGETAAGFLARVDEDELCEALRASDVPAPRRVARALCAGRPLRTVGDLLGALENVKLPHQTRKARQTRKAPRRHHPATLVFQALRMAVNEELAELESALDASIEWLAPHGRLAVLSYHSGEDRRTKAFLNAEAKGCICPPELPYCGCGREPRMRVLVRGERASAEEIEANPRARSARLRAGERL
jgi:16S rRNA (cytosine1402-N4)-methyltransferase